MSRDPLIGRTLSIYRIERLLGRGGMASVYFARDVNLQRPAAIKVMAERYRNDPAFAQRFITEARAVASWRHEHIVQIYYAGREDDLSFFAMEYIDGMDLAELLRVYAGENELMPYDDVVQIGRAVALALDYAHARGVIHRDVKPSNVMISTEDRVVLTDFGLALDTAQGSLGEVFGTPRYIAPEQARRSADAVPQSDLYSLGVMLYEMLTGGVPFDDPSPAAVALQHLTQPPPPPRERNPALNAATEQVLLKALSKPTADRYPNGAALIDALDDALHQPDAPTLDLFELDDSAESTSRLLSSRSVAERIAFYSQAQQTAERPDEMRVPPTARGAETPDGQAVNSPTTRPAGMPIRGRRRVWPIVLLIVALVVAAALALRSRAGLPPTVELVAVGSPTDLPPTHTPTTSPPARTLGALIVLATPEFTLAPPTLTPIPPSVTLSETPPPTAIPPSATPVPATNTTAPTQSPATEPSATISSPLPVSPAPTVLYPNGRSLILIWDDNSFYWHNPTNATMRLNDVDFEALDAAGNVLPYYFDGFRWTAFYNVVEPGDCAAIEITRSQPLYPPQCRDYNARMTPQRSSDMVFWLAQNGVAQFRVLWAGQEIGRCDVAVRTCEVRAQ
ncbi:MAG: protein kinase [Anaerolineae bacterium]